MKRRAFWVGAAQCISWGVLFYGFGLVLPAMKTDLGGHPALLTGAFSTALLVSAVVGLRVGGWIDAGHAKRVFFGGIVAGAAALLTWASSTSVWQLYLAMVLLGLAMAATLYEPAFAVIERWSDDPEAKNHALATVTLMGGFASPIFVPALGFAITHYGWRWAVAGGVVPLLATGLIYHRVLASETAAVNREPGPPAPFTPVLWWIAAAAFLSSFGGVVVSSYLPTFLTGRGFALSVPSMVIGCAGAAQVPTRLLTVRLLARWGTVSMFAAALTLQALAVIVLIEANQPWVLVLAGAGFGIGNGASTLVRAIGIRELVGPTGYATTLGRIGAFPIVARALAPVAAGGLSTVRPAEPLWVAVSGLVACSLVGRAVTRTSRRPLVQLSGD